MLLFSVGAAGRRCSPSHIVEGRVWIRLAAADDVFLGVVVTVVGVVADGMTVVVIRRGDQVVRRCSVC